MRRMAFGLAAGAMALAISTGAEGCDYRYRNYAEEPYMAELVRQARYIDLARITSVAPLLPDARQYWPNVETHEYVFLVQDALNATGMSNFTYRASIPYPPVEPAECVEREREGGGRNYQTRRSCFVYENSYSAFELANRLAESGHEDWRYFVEATPWSRNGNGGISPPEQGGGDCSWAESYLVGQTYLVFRDAAGEVMDSRGLNMQPVSRTDDRWLQAVQYFLANPDADWLPAQSAQEVLLRFDHAAIVRMDYCPDSTGTIDPDLLAPIATVERTVRGRDNEYPSALLIDNLIRHETSQLSACSPGYRYLFVQQEYLPAAANPMPNIRPLPIRDGMVDLSGIPSQHAIEPAQVPLDDVIAWLAESDE